MTDKYGNLELHTVLLSAMKDIDKICRENGLKYYLYAGTLLGAINFKGFIPWDDDIDIVMMPEDFEKLSQIIERDHSDIYEMITFDNTENWYSMMNKVAVKDAFLIGNENGEKTPIFIDINVLHSVPDRKWQRFVQRKKIEIINLILAAKSGMIVPTSAVSKMTIGNLAKINKSFWGKKLYKTMCRYDKKQTEYLGIMCNTLTRNPYTGRTGYETDFTKRESHKTPIDLEFEGEQLMTISNFEEYLTYQFGPHWAEPYPEEKRVTKHDVKTYEISDEVRKRVGLI